MTYNEALDFLNSASTPGSVYGLERINMLLEHLSRPQDKLRFIHIAGTNGKGSVSRMLACVLTAAGYKVGCFNSPCLVSPCEYLSVSNPVTQKRPNKNTSPDSSAQSSADTISTDLNPISASPEEFANEVARVMEATLDMLGSIFLDADPYKNKLFSNDTSKSPIASRDIAVTLRPTAFEYYTAMAIDYFARKECDFAIMECGLGGKDDSTNIIPSPEVAVITRIGLDHTEMLGPDIVSIAEAKSGIIKKGCSVVAYPSDDEALKVIEKKAERLGCPLSIADPGKLKIVREGVWEGDTISYDDSEEYRLSLPGDHQAMNAAVVLEIIKALKLRIKDFNAAVKTGLGAGDVDAAVKTKFGDGDVDAAVKAGLGAAKWPARLTLISKDPPVLLDGAHNPQCMDALCKYLKKITESFPKGSNEKRDFIVVTGVMADKDYADMFGQLAPFAGKVYAVRPDNPRSLDPAVIAEIFEGMGVTAVTSDSVSSALECAKEEIKKDGRYIGIIVTGSLYMMKPLLEPTR
ncbi:MAG: bifunctional folylpolyglutamate synthase/dihydrofolate synthase [Lachnospiraceae bacterium]|nr:bifunctional folylpolyglutamate synthase/dihydrofolate synthase [Lachnospiraceae bacterium]